MTIEIALLISIVSVVFGAYQGLVTLKRHQSTDDRKSASEMTTVIVKLENIGAGVSEIKNEMQNMKSDIKSDHDLLIKVDASARQAHKRLDDLAKGRLPAE